MEYFYSITDSFGCVHSIDMIYVEYFSLCNPQGIIEIVQKIHEDYPLVKYQEFLGRVPHSKWNYYTDGISIGGVYISAGKYNNYDPVTRTFDLLPMFEIRVNPNKHMNEPWFRDMLSRLLEFASSGMLRKFDYAVDISKPLKFVQVLDTRKEPGLYKGTRYYGQAGRHGYVKIYDKQKDMKRQGESIDALTRVEHTLFANQDPSLENVYVLSNAHLETDYSNLKDTDRAIIDMFLRLKALGYDYDLKLGRRKMKSLEPYLQGQYQKLDYGNFLGVLVDNIKREFHAMDVPVDEDGFVHVDESAIDDLPFD